MELVNPGLGLIFWMTVSFLILLFLLRKFAWAPILLALKQREDSIDDALKMAEKAREEMAQLKSKNDELLKEARADREILMKEARAARDQMIEDAKAKAVIEGQRILEMANENAAREISAAKEDLKNQLAEFSLKIAEQILKEKLSDDKKQQELIAKLIKEVNFN